LRSDARADPVPRTWPAHGAGPDDVTGDTGLTRRVQGVRLEPLDERWLDHVAALVADPDVLRFTRIPEPPPLGFERQWVESYATGRRAGTRDGFAATDGAGRFLGVGLAPDIDREAGEV